MKLRGQDGVQASSLYEQLINAINNVYDDVVNGNSGYINQNDHPMEYELFHNPFNVVDGPCYAFLVHGKGPAVLGQGDQFAEGDSSVTSSDIVIRNNIINDIRCWSNEVTAPVVYDADGSPRAANDARGAVLQLISTYDEHNPQRAINENGDYQGNVVSDLQMMVANAINEGVIPDDWDHMQTSINTISQLQVDWAKGDGPYVPEYRCNGDSMYHVIKGIVVVRVEDTQGFTIEDNSIVGVENHSLPPFPHCDGFHPGSSSENQYEQQAGNIRGISVAAVRGYTDGNQSIIRNNMVRNFESANANVIVGIDVQGDSSGVTISENTVDLDSMRGEDPMDEFYALRVRQNTDSSSVHVLASNTFSQDHLIQNAMNTRHLRSDKKRKLPEGHAPVELEWQHGGCPFAKRRA